MRKILTLLLIGAIALTACGNPEVTTTPDDVAPDVAAETSAPPESEPAAPEPEPTETATVGSTITLSGSGEGAEVSVKVVEVIDGADATQYSEPEAGHKLIAVRLELSNTGQAVYSDVPSNGARLINTANEQFTDTFARVEGCQEFAGGIVTLPPDAVAVGCLVYEVPVEASPARFQFALDSGFGPETGIWELG
ncbi:MAG: DUF4352 domain-containing protein [Egibacteraceae bacterium]